MVNETKRARRSVLGIDSEGRESPRWLETRRLETNCKEVRVRPVFRWTFVGWTYDG